MESAVHIAVVDSDMYAHALCSGGFLFEFVYGIGMHLYSYMIQDTIWA